MDLYNGHAMYAKTLAMAMVGLVAVTMTGCKKAPEVAVIGRWKQKAENSSLLGALVNSLTPRTSIELKNNHDFMLRVPNLAVSASSNAVNVQSSTLVEGTWSASGQNVKLRTTQVDGKPVEQAKREAQQSAAGQNSASNGSSNPRYSVNSSALTIPSDASLSDDQRRLTLKFDQAVQPPVDLEPDNS